MSQELYFNILTFDIPTKPVTFYFSKEKIGNAQEIYKNKFPSNIEELFPGIKEENPDFIYTSFIYEKKDYQALKLNLKEQPKELIKHYFNWSIKKHFKKLNKVVKTNFVKDVQVWIKDATFKNPTFAKYDKFTLKLQFEEVSDFGELVIAYDGTTKILKTPVSELVKGEVSTTILTGIIHNRSYFNFQKLPDDITDFSKTYAVLNNDIRNALGYEIDKKEKGNKYIGYKAKIDDFIKRYIAQDDFKKIIPVNCNYYLPVEKKRIGEVSNECNDLVFNGGAVGQKPKYDFKQLKPFKPCTQIHKNIHLFFIVHKQHINEAQVLQGYLQNGFKWYKGLLEYAGVLYHVEKNFSIVFDDMDNALSQITQGIKDLKLKPDVTYVAIYLSPFSKYEQNLSKKQVYYKVKEQLLLRRIVSQVIDVNKFKLKESEYKADPVKSNGYLYDLTNISLAILAKLEGIPWQLNITPKKELVIGVGAFKNVEENIRYVASAFSFQSNGKFNEFQYFSKSDTKNLANAISDAIWQYVNIVQEPDKVVIHFYKEMSNEEIEPVLDMMNALKLECPLYIVNINKTKSEDIIAFDKNWYGNLMPKSGTYINISKSEHKYLLFNNSRYNDSKVYPSTEGYPFPVKLRITSPTPEALNDSKIIKKLIEQVYQFSRLYWKSLRQQNVPITIKYPEMVAEIAPRFDGSTIPPYGEETLWFL
ncbi:Piwi domain-containing protein [Flavobacteriaceae bacterium LMO-SS05]